MLEFLCKNMQIKHLITIREKPLKYIFLHFQEYFSLKDTDVVKCRDYIALKTILLVYVKVYSIVKYAMLRTITVLYLKLDVRRFVHT